jgi:hypothetical protein
VFVEEDQQQHPIPDAVVIAAERAGLRIGAGSAMTDGNGEFIIGGLDAPGDYDLAIERSGWNPGFAVSIPTGGTAAVELEPDGLLTGKVLDANTLDPIEGAVVEVFVENAASDAYSAAISAPDGQYALQLSPGTYSVLTQVGASTLPSPIGSVVVPSNSANTLDILFPQ